MKKPLKNKGSNTVTLCQIISPYPFSFKYIMVTVISLYYYNNSQLVKPIIYMQILHNAKMIKIPVNLL